MNLHGRPSKSAAAARRREREIVAQMSAMERALRALELGERTRLIRSLAKK